MIDGTFYPFSGGTIYVGQYSANTTIDVSALGAASADQFLVVSMDINGSSFSSWEGSARMLGYGPALSLSNGVLSVTAPYIQYQSYNQSQGKWVNGARLTMPYKVYYAGEIESI